MSQQVPLPSKVNTTASAPKPGAGSAPDAPPPDDANDSGLKLQRIVMIAAGVLILLILLVFVAALLIARGNVDQLGPIIEIIRDLVIIFLALEGILIIMALAVLILQVARLINLLQNEVRPVLKNTQETIQTAKGTVEFVGDTVIEPVIRASAFMSAMSVVVGNAFGLRRAVNLQKTDKKDGADGKTG